MKDLKELESTFKIKEKAVNKVATVCKVDKNIIAKLLYNILEEIGYQLYSELDNGFKIEYTNESAEIFLEKYYDYVLRKIFGEYFKEWQAKLYYGILLTIYQTMKKNETHYDKMYIEEIEG